jgi:hypothetical protein
MFRSDFRPSSGGHNYTYIKQATRHPNSMHHQHDSTRHKQLYIKYDTQNHDSMLQLTNDVQKQGKELLFSSRTDNLDRTLCWCTVCFTCALHFNRASILIYFNLCF